MKRSNRNKRELKSGKRTQKKMSVSDRPAQIASYELSHSVPLRFTVTAAVVRTQLTILNFLETILLATTATVPFRVFDALKIRSIKVWSAAALGTPTTVAVVFLGNGQNGAADRKIFTDTSLGVKPAFVNAIPDSGSSLRLWQGSTSNMLIEFTAPAGSIIDVVMDLRNDNTAAAATNGSAGATVGGIFYRGLDGLAAATTNFPPVSNLPTF
jgi:hypothetical protein